MTKSKVSKKTASKQRAKRPVGTGEAKGRVVQLCMWRDSKNAVTITLWE